MTVSGSGCYEHGAPDNITIPGSAENQILGLPTLGFILR
jgi:hypothetical protein